MHQFDIYSIMIGAYRSFFPAHSGEGELSESLAYNIETTGYRMNGSVMSTNLKFSEI